MPEAIPMSIPLPTIRRLAQYLTHLRQLKASGHKVISGTVLAKEFQVQPIQVRKDLEFTGIHGKPKMGFPLASLVSAIEHRLGWDNAEDAFLIGAGNLGTALMGYAPFRENGLNIVAAFDADPAMLHHRIGSCEILGIDKLDVLIRRMHIQIAILTVPPNVAQSMVDIVVAAGIRAIWNFTPITLRVPDHIVVEDVRLAASLSVLTQRLRQGLQTKKA